MFFFSSRRRHTRLQGDWSSDVCSSDLSGVNSMGTKLTPRRPWAESSAASFWPSSHGAPSTSNGVSVPRPTERLVVSKRSEERRVGKGGRNGMGGDDERQ